MQRNIRDPIEVAVLNDTEILQILHKAKNVAISILKELNVNLIDEKWCEFNSKLIDRKKKKEGKKDKFEEDEDEDENYADDENLNEEPVIPNFVDANYPTIEVEDSLLDKKTEDSQPATMAKVSQTKPKVSQCDTRADDLLILKKFCRGAEKLPLGKSKYT